MARINNIIIKNARIMFRNFEGRESQYNRAGDRNFTVRIQDPDCAQELINEGWNVRIRPSRDPDEDSIYTLKVKVHYGRTSPDIRVFTSRNKEGRPLTEETVKELDDADLKKIDLEIRPYQYEVAGRCGVSAYLKTLWCVLEEGPFAEDYENYFAEEDEPF